MPLPTLHDQLNYGGWIPTSREALNEWLKDLAQKVEAEKKPFAYVIQKFQDLIESDPDVYMTITQMIVEANNPSVSNTAKLNLLHYDDCSFI